MVHGNSRVNKDDPPPKSQKYQHPNQKYGQSHDMQHMQSSKYQVIINGSKSLYEESKRAKQKELNLFDGNYRKREGAAGLSPTN
jgi:hypothetical protein